jgi:hypothetical protein
MQPTAEMSNYPNFKICRNWETEKSQSLPQVAQWSEMEGREPVLVVGLLHCTLVCVSEAKWSASFSLLQLQSDLYFGTKHTEL